MDPIASIRVTLIQDARMIRGVGSGGGAGFDSSDVDINTSQILFCSLSTIAGDGLSPFSVLDLHVVARRAIARRSNLHVTKVHFLSGDCFAHSPFKARGSQRHLLF